MSRLKNSQNLKTDKMSQMHSRLHVRSRISKNPQKKHHDNPQNQPSQSQHNFLMESMSQVLLNDNLSNKLIFSTQLVQKSRKNCIISISHQFKLMFVISSPSK